MAPASASLLPATSSAAGAKRPAAAAASDAEFPLAQEGAACKKNESKQQQLECPRCGSGNTKFCYYNNYSTTQPRHFCRVCRRYWTHGGTLRNVPVGGACRKRRRSSDELQTPSSASPPPQEEDARPRPDPLPVFPFLTDGAVFLPQFDLGLGALAGFAWTSATPDLYDGLVATWSGGLAAGAWDDFGGLELTWPPPAAGN